MTCRDEILIAVRKIINTKNNDEFTIPEVIRQMSDKRTQFSKNTIRTEISCRLCINAPQNHAVTHSDFERVCRGVYRLL